jgi:hypothetical protein
MSDYLVTDTELTSIANAIRTKGGTAAALEFPTDFVSAIGAIPSGGGALDWLGQGTELVSVIYPVTTTYLKDTNFHGWTPTTSQKTIKAAAEIEAITLDLSTYDYICRWDVNINLNYSSSNAWEQKIYACVGFTSVYRRPSNYMELTGQLDAYNACTVHTLGQYSKGLNGASNDYAWYATSALYGFYATPQVATIMDTSEAFLSLKFKTPTIICKCTSTYLTTASAQLIDENTSNFKIKGTLYRCPRGNSYAYKEVHEAVLSINNPMT